MHTDFIQYKKFESHSSYGEDSIFNGVLKRLSWLMQEDLFKPKTYIDIGAYHPIKESSTYFLYELGWFGTLVEPNSYMNVLTHELRPKDILLNYAVDSSEGTATMYMFGQLDSSNTISKDFAEKKQQSQHTNINWTVKVHTKTINQIITKHIDYFGQTPFFLNLDIEGMDYDVISTYNHDVKIPFIMIEDDEIDFFNMTKIRRVMEEKGYVPIASTMITTLYLNINSKYFKHIKKIGMY